MLATPTFTLQNLLIQDYRLLKKGQLKVRFFFCVPHTFSAQKSTVYGTCISKVKLPLQLYQRYVTSTEEVPT